MIENIRYTLGAETFESINFRESAKIEFFASKTFANGQKS